MLTLHAPLFRPFRSETFTGETLESVQAAWNANRDKQGFGASAMREGCGLIEKDGKPLCEISYNGRLWALDGGIDNLIPFSA